MRLDILVGSLLLLLSVAVYAGRMPNEFNKVESAGGGYVKLYSAGSELAGEYHIVPTYDLKRLMGAEKLGHCYVYYLSGAEMLKLVVKNQTCDSVLAEMKAANGS